MKRLQFRNQTVLGSVLASLMIASSVQAAEVDCENMDGTCRVSNDNGDRLTCECGEATGTTTSGGNEWDDLDLHGLSEVCDEQLESICPPIGDATGDTTTGGQDTEDTEDSEGSVDSGGSGTNPNAITCSNDWGQCEVLQTPHTTHSSCTCESEADAGVSEESSGGPDEGSLMTEEELLQWCEELLSQCDGADTGESTTGDVSDTSDSDDSGHVDPHDLFDCSVAQSLHWSSQLASVLGLGALMMFRRSRRRRH